MRIDKEKLLDRFQSLVVIRILCGIGLSLLFVRGPLSGLIFLYFYFFARSSMEQEALSATWTIGFAVVGFVLLLVLYRKLSVDTEKVRKGLTS
jgi:hypothetical protein